MRYRNKPDAGNSAPDAEAFNRAVARMEIRDFSVSGNLQFAVSESWKTD
jgi:hypothetical protein